MIRNWLAWIKINSFERNSSRNLFYFSLLALIWWTMSFRNESVLISTHYFLILYNILSSWSKSWFRSDICVWLTILLTGWSNMVCIISFLRNHSLDRRFYFICFNFVLILWQVTKIWTIIWTGSLIFCCKNSFCNWLLIIWTRSFVCKSGLYFYKRLTTLVAFFILS